MGNAGVDAAQALVAGALMAERAWFVTGCSSGLGQAIAEATLSAGDLLVATARREEALAHLAAIGGERVLTARLDVTDRDSIACAVREALARFERIDVLVNNAGCGVIGALEEVSENDIRSQFETNVFGTLAVTQAMLPHMRSRRRGHIVMMSSVGGFDGNVGSGIYNASKFAVEGAAEALAKEVAPLGIHVLIVEPGSFRTPFSKAVRYVGGTIADYETTVGERQRQQQTVYGREPGDPARAASAIRHAVEMAAPPLRLALGSDAVARIERKLQAVRADLDCWRAVACSTDFGC